jgi:hypothetical protein
MALILHHDLGKAYKSLKPRDLPSRFLRFPQGFPQNSGNLILRHLAELRIPVWSVILLMKIELANQCSSPGRVLCRLGAAIARTN